MLADVGGRGADAGFRVEDVDAAPPFDPRVGAGGILAVWAVVGFHDAGDLCLQTVEGKVGFEGEREGVEGVVTHDGEVAHRCRDEEAVRDDGRAAGVVEGVRLELLQRGGQERVVHDLAPDPADIDPVAHREGAGRGADERARDAEDQLLRRHDDGDGDGGDGEREGAQLRCPDEHEADEDEKEHDVPARHDPAAEDVRRQVRPHADEPYDDLPADPEDEDEEYRGPEVGPRQAVEGCGEGPGRGVEGHAGSMGWEQGGGKGWRSPGGDFADRGAGRC